MCIKEEEKMKEIKVKKEDQEVFKKVHEYNIKIEMEIGILTREIGYLRCNQRQTHEQLFDGILTKYKLDKNKSWVYSNVTNTLFIKDGCRTVDYEKELDDLKRQLDKALELGKTSDKTKAA